MQYLAIDGSAIESDVDLLLFLQADQLMLPKLLINEIKELGLSHFKLLQNSTSMENYERMIFPATCDYDSSEVHIWITDSGNCFKNILSI